MTTEQIQKLHDQSLVWDAHACFPLNPNANLSELKRYKANGVNFVSLNIGMDMDSFENIIQVLACYRKHIAAHPDDFVLALSVDDILKAKGSGKLAIGFDLEGSEPILGNLNLISFYYDLGVRQMLLAYNKDNRASGGCMEGKIGLTDFGKKVISEMNRVGMVVDVSHMGELATMDAFNTSTSPVIFSHSNPNGLRKHARNISDQQIKACAKTGGVVGINGIGDFLGGTKSEIVVENIEYVINLVGPEHVGIGLDYVVDKQELVDYIEGHPDVFPSDKFNEYLAFVDPEQFPEFTELLYKKGYNEQIIRGIMGENFLRVAEKVWK
ncbi:MAG TPA: membrane dipeptidase [Anaerolineales bacterium]|nr:membrane dipeptidase [Anaerolineales bacterium]